jgi:hypothetical protein
MSKQICIQVLLVGGRLAPNLFGVLLLRPQRIALIVSTDEKTKVDVLRNATENITYLEPLHEKDIHEVDAFDYKQIYQTSQDICRQYANEEVMFNITAGTKIMAIAALDVARNISNAKAFYLATSRNKTYWLASHTTNTVEEVDLSPFRIPTYLKAYGREPKEQPSHYTFKDEQGIKAAQAIVNHLPASRELLLEIRRIKGKGRYNVPLPNDNRLRSLIQELHQIDVIDLTQQTFIIRSEHDWNFFRGDWLDIFVCNAAKLTRIFQDVKSGLKIPSGDAEKEMDLVCLYNGELLLGSCKTDYKPFNTEYLDELSAVSSLIGGRFCSRIFITDAEFPDENQEKAFRAQAKQREIVIVTGNNLNRFNDIIKAEAIKPTFKRM